MENNLEPIQQLLDKHVDRTLLTGLYFGKFNPGQDKFFAAAYVPIVKEDYESVSWNLEQVRNNYSFTLPANAQKYRTYNDDKTYQHKSTKECVEEGLYVSYTISFIGCLYKGDWYIMTNLAYIGEGIDEIKAIQHAQTYYQDESFWQTDIFKPYQPTSIKTERTEINIKGTEYLQFGSDVPSLVAYEMYEQKEAAGRAYRTYMNIALCRPFARKLQIHLSDEYAAVYPDMMDDYLVMFSEDKKHNLIFARVDDKNGNNWLHCFLYETVTGKIYKWLYATTACNSFDCREEILNCLKDITIIDHYNYLWNFIVTLDDQYFWEEYVFKKESDNFKYLKEIVFS